MYYSIVLRSCIWDNAVCHAIASVESNSAGALKSTTMIAGEIVKCKDECRKESVIIRKRDT
jgi:hypothetical protein